MARSLTAASGHYLQQASGVVSGAPFSIALWAKPATNHVGDIFCLGNTSSAAYYTLFEINTSNQFFLESSGGGNRAISAGFTVGAWNHFAGVEAASNDRRAYVNGANKATNAGGASWSGLNRTVVGARKSGSDTAGTFFNGDVAEIGVWDVALTDDDVAALARGFSPLQIRPASLVAYWPLVGANPEPDRWKNRYVLSLFGSSGSPSKSDHLGIFYPSRPRVVRAAGVVAQAAAVALAIAVPTASLIAGAAPVAIVVDAPPATLTRIQPATAVGIAVGVAAHTGLNPYTVRVYVAGVDRTLEVRVSGMTPTEALNEEPEAASFTVEGFAPSEGNEVEVLIGLRKLFGGHITRVKQRYESKPENVVWDVDCQDYTWMFNRRLVNARYVGMTADAIILAIVADFTTGFTTDNVVADLPVVDEIEFTDETPMGAVVRVMSRVGGYAFIDADKDLHAFLEDVTEQPDPVTDAVLAVEDLATSGDITPIRTRVFVEGGGSNTPVEVAVGATRLPVEDISWYDPDGGLVKAGPQPPIAYTGVVAGGAGALVGTTVRPTNGPTLANAFGTGLSAGEFDYAYTFVTAAGETLPSPLASISVDTTPLAAPTTIGGASSIAPSSVPAWPGETRFNALDASASYSYKYTFKAGSGETTPSPASNSFTTASCGNEWTCARSGRLAKSGMQTPPAGASVQVYRTDGGGSTYKLLPNNGDYADGTYYYDGTGDGSLGASAPVDNSLVKAQVALSSIAIGPTGTTARRLYRTTADGTQLKLVTAIADNVTTSYTDSTVDAALGANAPVADTSGLVVQSGEISAGSTSMLVTSLQPFDEGGGWVAIGSMVVRYSGISSTSLTGIPSDGVGALTTTVRYGSEVVAMPMLVGIPTSGAGSILYDIKQGEDVNVVAQVDDLAAQAALAAREGGDGIHEHSVQDNRLSLASARSRGEAELALHATSIVTVFYKTRDPKTRAGKTVSINLGPPTNLVGDFKIQRVIWSEIGVSVDDGPLAEVEASNLRFSLEDLLRQIRIL